MVICEKTHLCSYTKCAHHGIHNYDEECSDTICHEFDTCVEPGDVIRCNCVPINKKTVKEHSVMTEKQKVMYKGMMVPAKEMSIGGNKTKLVPVDVDKYTLHGIPSPNNITVTEKVKNAAKDIVKASRDANDKPALIKSLIEGSKETDDEASLLACMKEIRKISEKPDSTPVLIKYIRKGQDGFVLGSRLIDENADPVLEYFATRGEPYGAVVAFMHEGVLKIGWSKRLEGFEEQQGKKKQKEPLSFTKKDAINIAVIRGLVDGIMIRGSGSVYTKSGEVIPKAVAKILVDFTKRSQHYFKSDAVNVKDAGN